uniref:Haloalkane dehalogenase n=1 Tax=Pithovirus LCPAC304 TaxID=2506594 RepID=A0A481Z9K5_9VIRU|nr:MAG: haloalkane dehalogenase [Pithovirus LCPAC304]
MYEAFSHSPDPDVGTEPRRSIYRNVGKPQHGKALVKTPFSGIVEENGEKILTDEMLIALTQWGDKGPIVLFLHGVPTNRRQWRPVQERLAPFCRTIAIDMLGMGESDKPLQYGKDQDVAAVARTLRLPKAKPNNPYKPWDWIFDTGYINQLMLEFYGKEKFIFVADDWGGGINSHFTARYGSKRLLAHVQLDPIAFDGYPVSEIQAIGRASAIEDEATFQMAMGALDQTMVQIFKTMVHKPDNVYNQYSLRSIKFPYIDVDYERPGASSMTMGLHWDAIRVLTDRSAILAPDLLLPYDAKKNPKGVKYDKIDVPTAVLWGDKDNMMPPLQRLRYIYAHSHPKAKVMPIRIGEAGHFAASDQVNWVSESILTFIIFVMGPGKMGDIFLGFDGIWKGDEAMMRKDLRRIYGM